MADTNELAINENTTLAELRRRAEPATTRRYGPFGNLWFRPMDFAQVGSVIKGHKHHYDHVTFLSRGAVLVAYELPTGERGERVYSAPAAILIRKNVIHEITALEPGTRADCIYALRDLGTGEVVDYWDGGLEAYS